MQATPGNKAIFYLTLFISCLIAPVILAFVGKWLGNTLTLATLGLLGGEFIVHGLFSYKYLTRNKLLALLFGVLIAYLIMMLGLRLSQSDLINNIAARLTPKEIFYRRILSSAILNSILAIPTWAAILYFRRLTVNNRAREKR